MLRDSIRKALLVIALAAFALASLGAAPPTNSSGPASSAPDRILVKFKAGTDANTAAAIHRQNGGTVVGTVRGLGVQAIAVPAGTSASKIASYYRNPNVQYAESDHIASAVGKPAPAPVTPAVSDTYFSKQWGMTKVQAPDAWTVTKGNSAIKIAILDTGIDQNHADLSSKIVAQSNFTDSATVDDLYGHGTHVAGIAAAITDNEIGVAGLGFNSSLMNGKVLDDSGSGYYSWIANGVMWAADNGAKVINMSLGGTYSDITLAAAVNSAWTNGAVIVAAAGNNGNSVPFYPAAYDNAIAVAATDSKDNRASFSNFGSWVDVAAPGVNIYSTYNDGAYTYMSGTSMASPHVAGLAALVWAKYGTDNADVRARIESGTDRLKNANIAAHGRINAYKAVKN